MPDRVIVKRALVSVSDKTGLVEFVRALASAGIEIVSTGGTAAALSQAGIPVIPIHRVTGFPEIMGGRVKTLHPAVHGGILAVRNDDAHIAAMKSHGIQPIDLVCVNLYPFEQTVARPGVSHEEAVENIDIGGPSMVRSAAKNHDWVAVVTDPVDYGAILDELRANDGATRFALRARLAARAFASTSRYDAAIAAFMGTSGGGPEPAAFPATLTLSLSKVADLRYGENPHQAGAVYRDPGAPPGIVGARQLHGKELSYNNLADAGAAYELAFALARVDSTRPGACIIKHTNPCGAAIGASTLQAVDQAIAGDPVAAYGGILAINTPLDGLAADRLAAQDMFLEVVVAPAYSPEALDKLRSRWTNVRLLQTGPAPDRRPPRDLRTIPGGALVQDRDDRLASPGEYQHRAGPPPSPGVLRLAAFMEPITRALLSNAVAIGAALSDGSLRLVGAGAGQMDRVTSCRIAVGKAGDACRSGLAFSDAFFPFADGPEILIKAGVKTIVHPGGSKRDQDTFDVCQRAGVTCLTMGLRHFRH